MRLCAAFLSFFCFLFFFFALLLAAGADPVFFTGDFAGAEPVFPAEVLDGEDPVFAAEVLDGALVAGADLTGLSEAIRVSGSLLTTVRSVEGCEDAEA